MSLQSQSSSDPDGSMSTSACTATTTSTCLPTPSPSSSSSSGQEEIKRKPWFEYAEGNLGRGRGGHGILKFFRHNPKVAHHIFYSILLGEQKDS